jgi:hypothetical protein
MREMNINLSILQIPDSENMQMNCRKLKQNDKTSPDERYFANFEIENIEDPIIVIKK